MDSSSAALLGLFMFFALPACGLLIGWAATSSYYRNRMHRETTAAREQARYAAWIEFQQAQQGITPPPSSPTLS